MEHRKAEGEIRGAFEEAEGSMKPRELVRTMKERGVRPNLGSAMMWELIDFGDLTLSRMDRKVSLPEGATGAPSPISERDSWSGRPCRGARLSSGKVAC